MFEPTEALIDLTVDKLRADYCAAHASCDSSYPDTLATVGRTVLEKISASDALYHNVNHTILVTLLGQEILVGKQLLGDTVSAKAWLDFLVSLLCHDVGFVSNLLREDGNGNYASGVDGETFTLPLESTDAALGPYHVDRSILFVHEQFAGHALLDSDQIALNIERTRFPVPDDEASQRTDDAPGLARAADLLAQAAEPHPRRRYPALFSEFEETGINGKLGYSSPRDILLDFPRFFSSVLSRYCVDGVKFLKATEQGRLWLANVEQHLATAQEAVGASPSG